jgi:DNA-binding NtrC family response regulator
MRQAQVLIYERDGKLAETLRPLSQQRGFRLRELRQVQACLGALRRHGPGVLVVRLGRDLEREVALVADAGRLFPETPVIVVGDSANPALISLAWDLGAQYALFPPQPIELLPELVEGFLSTARPSGEA